MPIFIQYIKRELTILHEHFYTGVLNLLTTNHFSQKGLHNTFLAKYSDSFMPITDISADTAHTVCQPIKNKLGQLSLQAFPYLLALMFDIIIFTAPNVVIHFFSCHRERRTSVTSHRAARPAKTKAMLCLIEKSDVENVPSPSCPQPAQRSRTTRSVNKPAAGNYE